MNFNLQLARQCLALSARAYREKSGGDKATSTEYLVWSLAGDLNTLVIAFRGSREPRDFIMDAKFLVKHFWSPACDDSAAARAKVHRGFQSGVVAVRDEIVASVRHAARIIVTGHSLGGARAILLAAWLRKMGLPVTDVITFGAPRVGNAAFASFYNAQLHDHTIRFEAQGDAVPWLPPYVLNGYRHVGRCAYLKNDGTVKLDPAAWTRPAHYAATKLPNSQPSTLNSQLLGLFKPHYVENYERLFNQLKA